MNGPLIVAGLCLRYPNQPGLLLENVSFALQPGELLWLRGPNGSGKTSLLNCLSGVIPQHVKAELTGAINLGCADLITVPITRRFRFLAYQMSDPDSQIFFPRVEKELAFALENLGLPVGEIRDRIGEEAAFFGLEGYLRREPATLSYGEKKLLLFAVCAALRPSLLLLDEPSSGLGDRALEKLRAWLEKALASGCRVVLTEHGSKMGDLAAQNLDLGH